MANQQDSDSNRQQQKSGRQDRQDRQQQQGGQQDREDRQQQNDRFEQQR